MRGLTVEEMEQVDGGIGVFGAVTGAAAGAIGAAVTGGGFREIATGAVFGAVSGFFLGVAGASSGFARAAFTVYGLETGAVGSRAVYEMSSRS